MLSRVQLTKSGDSPLLPGELIDRLQLLDTNEKLIAQDKEPAAGVPVLLGVTKAALSTDSFLSASSFQHTIRVLAGAAIERQGRQSVRPEGKRHHRQADPGRYGLPYLPGPRAGGAEYHARSAGRARQRDRRRGIRRAGHHRRRRPEQQLDRQSSTELKSARLSNGPRAFFRFDRLPPGAKAQGYRNPTRPKPAETGWPSSNLAGFSRVALLVAGGL